MRRVRVEWTTTEVTSYEAVFEVSDEYDAAAVDPEPDFWDGNCPELVDHEDVEFQEHGLRFDEFTRETSLVMEEP